MLCAYRKDPVWNTLAEYCWLDGGIVGRVLCKPLPSRVTVITRFAVEQIVPDHFIVEALTTDSQ